MKSCHGVVLENFWVTFLGKISPAPARISLLSLMRNTYTYRSFSIAGGVVGGKGKVWVADRDMDWFMSTLVVYIRRPIKCFIPSRSAISLSSLWNH